MVLEGNSGSTKESDLYGHRPEVICVVVDGEKRPADFCAVDVDDVNVAVSKLARPDQASPNIPGLGSDLPVDGEEGVGGVGDSGDLVLSHGVAWAAGR